MFQQRSSGEAMVTLSHVGYTSPGCADRTRALSPLESRRKGTWVRPEWGWVCAAQGEQRPSLSRRKNAGRMHGLTVTGLRRVYLYLQSVRVPNAEMKHLNLCSSREQNESGLRKFSIENGKWSAREMAFFVRLQHPPAFCILPIQHWNAFPLPDSVFRPRQAASWLPYCACPTLYHRNISRCPRDQPAGSPDLTTSRVRAGRVSLLHEGRNIWRYLRHLNSESFSQQ